MPPCCQACHWGWLCRRCKVMPWFRGPDGLSGRRCQVGRLCRAAFCCFRRLRTLASWAFVGDKSLLVVRIASKACHNPTSATASWPKNSFIGNRIQKHAYTSKYMQNNAYRIRLGQISPPTGPYRRLQVRAKRACFARRSLAGCAVAFRLGRVSLKRLRFLCSGGRCAGSASRLVYLMRNFSTRRSYISRNRFRPSSALPGSR